MDEFLIKLQAKLDEAKSKNNINSDIEKIQKQINKLKMQAEIDPKTISDLNNQLESVLNQKINISDINVDTNKVDTKNVETVGQKIGQTIVNSLQEAISDKNVGRLKMQSFIVLNCRQ